MSFPYLQLDDYYLIASGICCELQISYKELVYQFRLQKDDCVIVKRRRAVDYHLSMMYYKHVRFLVNYTVLQDKMFDILMLLMSDRPVLKVTLIAKSWAFSQSSVHLAIFFEFYWYGVIFKIMVQSCLN
jgi:hypothetical protein